MNVESNFTGRGYAGKILRVDLSRGKISSQPMPEKLVKQFVGGRGINLKFLYDEVPPGVDPLSRENKIVIGFKGFIEGASYCCK